MKRILFAGLVGLMFAACSSEDVPENNANTTNQGNRYMAINIVANNANSRAESDYAAGDADEYAVVDATKSIFYFFKADGSAYPVTDDSKNYVTGQEIITENAAVSTDANVTTTKVMIVLSNKQATEETPAKVVAVINANYSESASSVTLANLQEKVVTSVANADNTCQMMSNAVYNDGAENVYATEVSAANLATTADLAAANPVDIYVERLVGKVTLAEGDIFSTTNVKYYPVTLDDITLQGEESATVKDVKAKVLGFQLFDKVESGYLLKNIEFETAPTWNWSVVGDHRSFWAAKTEDVAASSQKLSWNDMQSNQGRLYTFENISTTAPTSAAFAVKLVNVAADGTEIPLDLAKWLSKYYTKAGLKSAIANYLSHTLYSKETTDAGTVWKSITAADIDFEAYENGWQLKPKVSGKWYAKDSSTELSDTELTTILEAVPKAQIWEGGMCYYYTPIVHAIDTFTGNGIIRNHWYQLDINSITGLGTPVYDPDQSIDPQKPSDSAQEEWFLDAQINVLAWRIITQTLDLQ